MLFISTAVFAQTYTVERVVDGDTLKLTSGEKVRLIGVDTPETVHQQVHSFRRSFACMMDKAVQDRVAIQQTLGHATMTMTDRYCGYRPKEYVDKAHLKTTELFIKKLNQLK